jgi:NACalpha-BTF3-like transcription factor
VTTDIKVLTDTDLLRLKHMAVNAVAKQYGVNYYRARKAVNAAGDGNLDLVMLYLMPEEGAANKTRAKRSAKPQTAADEADEEFDDSEVLRYPVEMTVAQMDNLWKQMLPGVKVRAIEAALNVEIDNTEGDDE